MKKTFLLILIFFSLVWLSLEPKKVYALTETFGDLEVTYDSPLFGQSVVWYPGLSLTTNFTVKNVGTETHKVYISADNTSGTGDLSTVLYFKVGQAGTIYYGQSESKTLGDFWNDGNVNLSEISKNQLATYDLTINFWQGAGNEFQNKQAQFDLVIGFEGTTDKIPINAVTGQAVSTSSSPAPGSPSPGSPPPPLVSPSPAAYGPSNLVFSAPTAVFSEVGVTEGVATESSALAGVSNEAMPEVKGETSCALWQLWWLPLLIQAILTVIYYQKIKNRLKPKQLLIPVILAGLSQIIHQIFGCECVKSRLCSFYWLINLFVFSALTFSSWKSKKKLSSD